MRYVGWNFGEAPLEFPAEGDVVVMDLPLLEPFGMEVLCGAVGWRGFSCSGASLYWSEVKNAL